MEIVLQEICEREMRSGILNCVAASFSTDIRRMLGRALRRNVVVIVQNVECDREGVAGPLVQEVFCFCNSKAVRDGTSPSLQTFAESRFIIHSSRVPRLQWT